VLGSYATAAGWPWVDGTHSWLEPTALAVLALCREGFANHRRVDDAIELILDRALPAGGWNYGNTRVFGRDLRPQPGPTGVALLALGAREVRSNAVARGVEYLRNTLPEIGAAVSLGWGVLGLRAHGACPRQSDLWLAESVRHAAGRADATMGLALLLMAGNGSAINLLIGPSRNPPARNAQ
jgi:hypothetical protein